MIYVSSYFDKMRVSTLLIRDRTTYDITELLNALLCKIPILFFPVFTFSSAIIFYHVS